MNDKQSLSLATPELLSFFDGDEIIRTHSEQTPKAAEATAEANIENHAPLAFEGNNSNGLLLVFAHSGKTGIQDTDRPLLERLVENPAALHKKLSDCAILNLAQTPADWDSILRDIQPKQIICWDSLPTGLTLAEKYKTEIHHGVKVVWSDSIAQLEADAKLKVPLWNELKKHFL
ncbi:MAG: hypothetical protein EP332_04400 [Bacteroidetes bacterium]|nr:MAG: hypothetical protein EP332_04400 [Bacteroidota bacterium]